MSGYLETKTAEKLQLACDSITRVCKVYEIAQLRNLGFITENIAKGRLEAIGIRFGNEESKAEQARNFVPTRIFAKMLGITEGENWFWYANDIFTTHSPKGDQAVHIDEIMSFLNNNPTHTKRIKEYLPMTEEELAAKDLILSKLGE